MDSNEFRERCQEMIDYVVDYIESISRRSVTADVPQGNLMNAFPSTPPKDGESFEKIMEDFEKYIMPGLVHWQHPGFHAHFPSPFSFPALLGNMLADIFSIVSLNWDFSPSGSELEVIILNWYGKLIGLPNSFLHDGYRNRGTGIIQKSTGECIFICVITARQIVLRMLEQANPSISRAALLASLVIYCSKESHSSIQKISLITLVSVRVLDTDKDHRLRGKTLAKVIENDKKIGLIPFFVNITLGTASCGACDPINEIGPICEKYDIWLNVDATYGGTLMVCPEYRHFLDGIEYASSFNSSPAFGMLMHHDCSVMFVKDRYKIKDAVVIDRTVYGYNFIEKDWAFPCNTEFRVLKLIFVMRNYGVEGIQRHARNYIQLAEIFEHYVKRDERFEFLSRQLGIVCFRLKGTDKLNAMLNESINSSGKLFMNPTCISGKYVIRYLVCDKSANEGDVKNSWNVICDLAEKLLKEKPKETDMGSSYLYNELRHKYNLP